MTLGGAWSLLTPERRHMLKKSTSADPASIFSAVSPADALSIVGVGDVEHHMPAFICNYRLRFQTTAPLI